MIREHGWNGTAPPDWSRHVLSLIVVALLAGVGLADETKQGKHVVAIIAGPNADTGIVTRTELWVSEAFRVDVCSRTSDQLTGDDIIGLAAAADAGRQTHDWAAIAFVYIPTNTTLRWAPSARAAVVNLSALQPEALDSAGSVEKYARRVEREAVRALGRMLMMPACVLTTCALSEHASLKELDVKGRGLCPPCMMRSEHLVRRVGVASGE